MKNLFKGIIVGMGGVSPGLSGSVLLVIFGLYQKTIDAIGHLFKNFKKNIVFLMPIVLGLGIGVLLFSKVIKFFLSNYEMQTRFTFLGLILGTIPLFYKQVVKEGMSRKYYILIAISAIIGVGAFTLNKNAFPQIENPSTFQSVLLGTTVAGSSIVPGVDSAVILSSLGLYELYVESLASLNLQVLIPAGIGLVAGALAISFIMSRLIKKYYTATFSIIFGLFIAIIPNVLTPNCKPMLNTQTAISFIMLIIGFCVSYYLGNIDENNEKLKKVKMVFGKIVGIRESRKNLKKFQKCIDKHNFK